MTESRFHPQGGVIFHSVRNWEDVEPRDTQEVYRLGPVHEY